MAAPEVLQEIKDLVVQTFRTPSKIKDINDAVMKFTDVFPEYDTDDVMDAILTWTLEDRVAGGDPEVKKGWFQDMVDRLGNKVANIGAIDPSKDPQGFWNKLDPDSRRAMMNAAGLEPALQDRYAEKDWRNVRKQDQDRVTSILQQIPSVSDNWESMNYGDRTDLVNGVTNGGKDLAPGTTADDYVAMDWNRLPAQIRNKIVQSPETWQMPEASQTPGQAPAQTTDAPVTPPAETTPVETSQPTPGVATESIAQTSQDVPGMASATAADTTAQETGSAPVGQPAAPTPQGNQRGPTEDIYAQLWDGLTPEKRLEIAQKAGLFNKLAQVPWANPPENGISTEAKNLLKPKLQELIANLGAKGLLSGDLLKSWRDTSRLGAEKSVWSSMGLSDPEPSPGEDAVLWATQMTAQLGQAGGLASGAGQLVSTLLHLTDPATLAAVLDEAPDLLAMVTGLVSGLSMLTDHVMDVVETTGQLQTPVPVATATIDIYGTGNTGGPIDIYGTGTSTNIYGEPAPVIPGIPGLPQL